MKIEISICTGLMLNDHSNPYIESTTVLSDTYAYMHVTAQKHAAKWIRSTSNHLVKWFGWNRFECALVLHQCAFSVDATDPD